MNIKSRKIFSLIVFILTVAVFIANIFSNNVAEIVLSIALFACGVWIFINAIILCKQINKDVDKAFCNGLVLEPIFFALILALLHKFLF